MATPIGHALAGITIARRMGVRSPLGMAAAVVAAGLPDLDVVAGAVLHRDPWKVHKQGTHSLGFAFASGGALGVSGIFGATALEGDRDRVVGALTGAALVGSHIVMDRIWMPYLDAPKRGPLRTYVVKSAWNWAVDAAVYGFIAYRFGAIAAPPAGGS